MILFDVLPLPLVLGLVLVLVLALALALALALVWACAMVLASTLLACCGAAAIADYAGVVCGLAVVRMTCDARVRVVDGRGLHYATAAPWHPRVRMRWI